MRVLAVIGEELAGFRAGGEWSVLSSLVAANGPGSVDVRVMALVNQDAASSVFSNPLGRAMGSRVGGHVTGGRDAGESARQRLDRAFQYLADLGIHADGDIETGSAYDAVRREVGKGGIDRVLVLVPGGGVRARLRHDLVGRLRRSLTIPVDGPADAPPS